MTQEELSRQFNVSRATAGRMLRHAQEEGIVEIRVRPQAAYSADLQGQLIERFGVQRALIVVDHGDVDRQRDLLAGVVAAYLERTVSDDSIVAVSMGRNVSAVSEHAISAAPRACTFASAIGGSYRGGEAMNVDHIARRLAARFGGEAQTLYAPTLIGDPALREVQLANDTVRHALDKARRADLALVGVGDISESSDMVRMGWFTPEVATIAANALAVLSLDTAMQVPR